MPLARIFRKNYFVLCSLLWVFISTAHAQQTQQPLPILQSGHHPTAIALRPDGQLAITGGYDGLLKWWDRKTGLLIRTVAAHFKFISTITFSADGTQFLSGGMDGFIKVWDTESGRMLASFRASPGSITHAAFDPKGEVVAACAYVYYSTGNDIEANTISLWDVRSGRLIKTLKGHSSQVTYLDFNPLGDVLVSASEDKTLKVWSVQTGQLIKSIPTNGKNEFVDYSQDGRTIAAIIIVADSRNPEVGFFNAQTGRRLYGFNDNEYWGGMAISANWRYFAVTSGQQLKLWDIENGQLNRTEPLGRSVSKLAISADGSTLALDGESSAVFWPSNNLNPPRPQAPLLNFTTGLAINRDGRLIAWGGGNEVYIWDRAAAAMLHILRGHEEGINEVAFSPDGSTLASCSNSVVKLWSVRDGAWLGDLVPVGGNKTANDNWNGSQSVIFSPDGRLIATGELKVSKRGEEYVETLGIRVWDARTRRLIKSFPFPERPPAQLNHPGGDDDFPYWIRSIAFSPDSRTIASDDGSDRVMLLDVKTGRLRGLSGHEKEINSIAFSPDGKRLVSGSFDTTVKLWDVKGRSLIRTLKQHKDRITTVKFSPDGRVIASGSRDNTVKLWDANTGANLATLEEHDEPVTSVGFSPDNSNLFSTSIDGTVNFYSVSARALTATLAADSENSWVCFSPDGYYKGNDAEKFLAWRVGNQVYPVSTFQTQFSRPDILLAKLNGLPLAVASKQPQSAQPPATQPPQPERGADVRVRYPGNRTTSVELYKRSYALLIGNSEYTNWNDLPGVRLDMQEVRRALEKQGFKVVSFDTNGDPLMGRFTLDVTRAEFRRQIEQFIAIYGQDEENRLLIYYAGHGYTALLPDGRKMGYLVMNDAPRMPPVEEVLERPLSSRELNAFYRASVNMDEIETFAKNISARHALFVFDSCFAGTVLFRDGEDPIPPYISEEVTKPVREFLTAGSERQRVLDDSPFRKAFVRGIEGAADTANGDNPKDGYILASELAAYIKQEVSRYTRNQQTPVFGKILKQELARGDFVFVYTGY
jgi:WD40 repeat protein/uncharacterized caspase-like protein